MVLIFFLLGANANSEQSIEEIIKARKALFSKNYNTAKRVQALSSSGKFDDGTARRVWFIVFIYQPRYGRC